MVGNAISKRWFATSREYGWKQSSTVNRNNYPRGKPISREEREEKKQAIRDSMQGEALYGLHGVRQALRCKSRDFHKLILRDTNQQQVKKIKHEKQDGDDKILKEIKQLALECGIPVSYERLVGKASNK